jgi:hypothetical protein
MEQAIQAMQEYAKMSLKYVIKVYNMFKRIRESMGHEEFYVYYGKKFTNVTEYMSILNIYAYGDIKNLQLNELQRVSDCVMHIATIMKEVQQQISTCTACQQYAKAQILAEEELRNELQRRETMRKIKTQQHALRKTELPKEIYLRSIAQKQKQLKRELIDEYQYHPQNNREMDEFHGLPTKRIPIRDDSDGDFGKFYRKGMMNFNNYSVRSGRRSRSPSSRSPSRQSAK